MKKKELIERLKHNKENCEQFNFFNEDCHKELDNMIEVLEKGMDWNEAEETYSDSVAEIVNALNGDIDVEDILYPEK